MEFVFSGYPIDVLVELDIRFSRRIMHHGNIIQILPSLYPLLLILLFELEDRVEAQVNLLDLLEDQ